MTYFSANFYFFTLTCSMSYIKLLFCLGATLKLLKYCIMVFLRCATMLGSKESLMSPQRLATLAQTFTFLLQQVHYLLTHHCALLVVVFIFALYLHLRTSMNHIFFNISLRGLSNLEINSLNFQYEWKLRKSYSLLLVIKLSW